MISLIFNFINVNRMKHYSIIEDLDLETFQILTQKSHVDTLSDCFIRNFGLIRKYANQENQLFLTKFKRKIIPKYSQQLVQHCQSQVIKNRQLFYARRRIFFPHSCSQRKNRQSLPQLGRNPLLNQYKPSLPDQVLQTKSYPILCDQKKINSNDQSYKAVRPNIIQPSQSSQKIICGPMFLISSKKRLFQLEKVCTSQKKSGNIYPNIYNDSINFCKNFLLKTTFDQFSRKKQEQANDGLVDLFNAKKTLVDQKSIEIKMMDVLKKRKSSRNPKMKISSNFISSKKLSTEVADKENILKRSNKSLNKEANQEIQDKKIGLLGLKGKICIPMKHKISSSCIFTQHKFSKETHQVFESPKQFPSINGLNKLLNNTQTKFTLPKFN